MEPPIVAGVAGGVGTTLVAQALRGADHGIYGCSTAVDVLVCRSTLYSVSAAQRALQTTPAPPILAIVDDVPHATWGTNTTNKIRLTEPYVYRYIRIPMVAEWRDNPHPHAVAGNVLVDDERSLPKGIRSFAEALRELVDVVTEAATAHCPQSA
ncbi:hypothetical protein [Pseudonocardia sp. ICBG601]|uniref:hypothetical protein n=1 Tax=Pseudonocardia sp. ICBG601 TaxID=2846759 RepID=UPI001CF66078|nr:hypothetical protein [Pseudonocardia sp. ICBG601]